MRKEVPMFITALSALLVIFAQYFFVGQQTKLLDVFDKGSNLMWGLAIGLGVVNLTQIHWGYIKRRREHWWASVVLLVAMWGYGLWALFFGMENPVVDWAYNALIVPLDSTLYGMIAFFITSAAYRVFRVRTLEATLLLVAALIVLLGTAPIGDVIIPGWSSFKEWILSVPNTAGMRGILIGLYLGSWATALRILLGLERAHLGGAT